MHLPPLSAHNGRSSQRVWFFTIRHPGRIIMIDKARFGPCCFPYESAAGLLVMNVSKPAGRLSPN